MPKQPRAGGGMKVLLAVAAAAPILVLVAVIGARTGAWSASFGFETLTMIVARYLALAGVAAAALSVVLALKDMKRRWVFAAAAVVLAGATLAGFLMQQGRFDQAAPIDVSTDVTETPSFSRLVQDERRKAGAVVSPGAKACAAAVPSQMAPEAATAALEAAGFTVVGSAPFRAEGFRKGFWFGFTHDAVIRIRPGQTDVRVTAREGVAQGDVACRMATAIVAELQARR